MKPFDLEKALAGEPVVTRDGRTVKIAGYNPNNPPFSSLLGWVGISVTSWDKFGKVLELQTSQSDLFMAEKPKVKKYTDEWLMKNYLTEETVIALQKELEESINNCKTSKLIHVASAGTFEFILPVLLKHPFSVAPFHIHGTLEITITI